MFFSRHPTSMTIFNLSSSLTSARTGQLPDLSVTRRFFAGTCQIFACACLLFVDQYQTCNAENWTHHLGKFEFFMIQHYPCRDQNKGKQDIGYERPDTYVPSRPVCQQITRFQPDDGDP